MRCFRCWREGIPPLWLVVLGALLVQVGFGIYPVIVKKFGAQENANPFILSFYRDFCCFPLLFMCAFVAERKIILPRPKMLLLLAALGVMGMFGNQALFILGVYKAGPDIASAFQPIIPVWTVVLAILTCTEKFPNFFKLYPWAKVLGILFSAGGAIELTLTGQHSANSNCSNSSSSDSCLSSTDTMIGYIALFGNTFCMSVYVLLQKRFIFNSDTVWKDSPVNVTAYSYFFGALFMGLFGIYFAAKKEYSEFNLPGNAIYLLVYAIFITSAMCYLLITWSNVHLPATVVTAFWPFQVFVAVLLSFFITGDKLSNLQYIGVIMLLIGLLLVLLGNHLEERVANGRMKDIDLRRVFFPWRKTKRKEERIVNDEEKNPLINSVLANSCSKESSNEKIIEDQDEKNDD